MKTLRDSVLKRIRESRLEPIPRWKILTGRGAIFGLLGLILVMGALASALVFFQSEETGWHWRSRFHFPLPIFWIVIGILALLLSSNVFTRTPRGYRWPKAVVYIFGILFVLGFGRALHHMGASGRVDGFLERHAGFYSGMCRHARSDWMNPAEGRLMGEVISGPVDPVSPLRELTIKDLHGTVWKVGVEGAVFPAPRDRYIDSGRLRIIGKQQQGTGTAMVFQATEVYPMRGGMYDHGRRH